MNEKFSNPIGTSSSQPRQDFRLETIMKPTLEEDPFSEISLGTMMNTTRSCILLPVEGPAKELRIPAFKKLEELEHCFMHTKGLESIFAHESEPLPISLKLKIFEITPDRPTIVFRDARGSQPFTQTNQLCTDWIEDHRIKRFYGPVILLNVQGKEEPFHMKDYTMQDYQNDIGNFNGFSSSDEEERVQYNKLREIEHEIIQLQGFVSAVVLPIYGKPFEIQINPVPRTKKELERFFFVQQTFHKQSESMKESDLSLRIFSISSHRNTPKVAFRMSMGKNTFTQQNKLCEYWMSGEYHKEFYGPVVLVRILNLKRDSPETKEIELANYTLKDFHQRIDEIKQKFQETGMMVPDLPIEEPPRFLPPSGVPMAKQPLPFAKVAAKKTKDQDKRQSVKEKTKEPSQIKALLIPASRYERVKEITLPKETLSRKGFENWAFERKLFHNPSMNEKHKNYQLRFYSVDDDPSQPKVFYRHSPNKQQPIFTELNKNCQDWLRDSTKKNFFGPVLLVRVLNARRDQPRVRELKFGNYNLSEYEDQMNCKSLRSREDYEREIDQLKKRISELEKQISNQ